MEPQKFYDYTYGVYCVHFPNKRGLSMDEIEIIFSEFGKVVSVAKSGDDYGYRFVKYKKEDEVIRCVEGLRNHESIKLKPRDPNYKKNKKQNNHNNQPGTSHGQKNHEHNGQRTEFNDDNNRLENKEEPKSNLIEIPQPKPKKLSVGEQRIYDARWGPQNPYEGETIEQRARRLLGRLYDPINRGSLLRRPEIPSGGLMSARAKFGADNVQNSLVTSYGRPDEIVNKIVRASDNSDAAGLLVEVPVPCLKTVEYPENLPRLVMRNSNSNGAGNMGGERGPLNLDVLAPKTVTAEQVIVANIHSDFGVNYILHLFRKHNPLGVSEMKIAPSRGIRFCIVYLESLHQAYAIEKEFDRYDLSGKDLIVLRPETLLDLAA